MTITRNKQRPRNSGNDNATFAELIRAAGLSYDQVAAEIGVYPWTVYSWVRPIRDQQTKEMKPPRQPRGAYHEKLQRLLGVDEAQLLAAIERTSERAIFNPLYRADRPTLKDKRKHLMYGGHPMRQGDIAQILHVTVTSVSHWESGVKPPGREIRGPYAQALHLSPAAFQEVAQNTLEWAREKRAAKGQTVAASEFAARIA